MADEKCLVFNPGGKPCSKPKGHTHRGDVKHDPESYGFNFKEAVEAELQCDFCGDPPSWWYKSEKFQMVVATALIVTFDGDWAACETCKGFIESENYEALRQRSIDTHPDKERLTPDFYIPFVNMLHTHFREHLRPGGPKPVTERLTNETNN